MSFNGIYRLNPNSAALDWNARLDKAETKEERSQILEEWGEWLASEPDGCEVDVQSLFLNASYLTTIPRFSAPKAFDTTIDKDTTTRGCSVVLGAESPFSTINFDAMPPSGLPCTMNLTIGGIVVAVVCYQSCYNDQLFNFYYVHGRGDRSVGTYYLNKKFAEGDVALDWLEEVK